MNHSIKTTQLGQNHFWVCSCGSSAGIPQKTKEAAKRAADLHIRTKAKK